MTAATSDGSDLTARLAAADAAVTRRFTRARRSVPDTLADLAETFAALPEEHRDWDRYAEGGPVAALESRVAELLGKPDAAFFPSGIMGQQAILRTWCDRRASRRIALPDLSHLLVHEMDGPRLLHGFVMEHLTEGPEVATARHLEAVPGRLGAALVELPLRDAGYLLPTWEELVELSGAARERGVPLHLDGARLWESAPAWDRSLHEIAALADSVYVSFYKGLGGMAGACVAGDTDVIAETRRWRKRMGGTLFSVAPYALGALRGLDEALPLMPRLHTRAVELAHALQDRGFRTTPETPHAVAFQLHAPAAPTTLKERAVEVMTATATGIPAGWRASTVPGWSWTELTVEPVTLEMPVEEIADLLGRLLSA